MVYRNNARAVLHDEMEARECRKKCQEYARKKQINAFTFHGFNRGKARK